MGGVFCRAEQDALEQRFMAEPAVVSVTQLMTNFAEACRSLAPALDFAHVHWRRREERYDNFDRVAEALFFSLVVEPCLFHAGAEGADAARYGFSYDQLPAACIVVNGAFRFVQLETTSRPFDTVSHERGEVPLASATFSFAIGASSAKREFSFIDLSA
jgi:hypothetical protein